MLIHTAQTKFPSFSYVSIKSFSLAKFLSLPRDTTLSTSLQLWIKSTERVSHCTASHNAHPLLELYFTLWNEVMKEILSNLYSDQQEIKFFSNHGRLICIAVRLKVSEKLKKRVVSSCCLALVIGVLPWINKYKKKRSEDVATFSVQINLDEQGCFYGVILPRNA